MEKIQPHRYFELRKKFEDETQLKIGKNKDAYIRYLETLVLSSQDTSKLETVHG